MLRYNAHIPYLGLNHDKCGVRPQVSDTRRHNTRAYTTLGERLALAIERGPAGRHT